MIFSCPLQRAALVIFGSLFFLVKVHALDAMNGAPANNNYSTTYGADKFSKAPQPAWVKDIPIPEVTKPSAEPNMLVLGDAQLRWDEHGKTGYFHRVLRANNTSGLQYLGQVQLDFNPEYQSLTLHTLNIRRAGAVVDKLNSVKIRFLERELGLEQSVYNGSATVALLVDDVRVGDELDLAYSIQGDNPVFNGVIADSSTWQTFSPVKLRRVSLQVLNGHAVSYRFIGAENVATGVKPVEKVSSDGIHEWVFEQRDVPAFRFEDFYPAGYQPVTWLQVSEYKNWNQVAKWAADLFQPLSGTSTEYRTLVARLQQINDPQKRAAAALDYVQSEIRYVSLSFGENSHRPASPDTVLARRYGDCKDKSLLLTALFKSLGISAKPVLVGVSAHNGFDKWLPGAAPFDHAIVRADIKGKAYWLDATALQKPADIATVGHIHDDADVLVVDSKTESLQRIERDHAEPYIIREHVRLENLDGSAVIEHAVTMTGANAESFRAALMQSSIDEIKKKIINDAQRFYAEPEWVGDLSIDDNAEANKVTYIAKYRVKRYVEKSNSGWFLRYRPSYISTFFSVPEAPRRSAPYAITFPINAIYSHEVELPAGISVINPDVNLTIASPAFNIHYSQHREKNVVRAEYEFSTLTTAVQPNEMDRFVADIHRVQDEMPTVIFIYGQQTATTNDPSLDELQDLAAKGDAKAQFELGMRYASGQSIRQDFSQAYSWWLKSAGQGYVDAQYYLAQLLSAGQGVARDSQAALVWYIRAAEQNHVDAQFAVGKIFAWGTDNVKQDFAEALKWWRKAADNGSARAQFNLGLSYADGNGVDKDDNQAFAWWKKAADQGVAEAQNNLGILYEGGNGRAKDLSEAEKWYHKAAEQGYVKGQFNLGRMYWYGLGVQRDAKRAAELFRRAAEQGHSGAQYLLGLAFDKGDGVSKDMTRALYWYLRAADQGVARAQCAVGEMLEAGLGTERDSAQATLWFKRAALQNYGRAQYALGLQQISDRALKEAYVWFSLAEKNEAKEAAAKREQLGSELTPEQLAFANREIREWPSQYATPKLQPAKLIKGEQPEYPMHALRLGVEGDVVLDLIVDKNGAVNDAVVLASSGSTELDDAAQTAVQKYVFSSASQDGQSVMSSKQLKINFKISDH